MQLSPALEKKYTRDQLSAREAQRLAEFIAFGPVVFQVARLMLKWGILDLLRDSNEGLTRQDIVKATDQTDYAVKVLLESSLTMGLLLINPETERYSISKVGWFLLNDKLTRVNLNFNHDVNYQGLFHLEEALKEGRPAGLKHFGPWPTIYEGLSELPADAQNSWFAFDHFYSDSAFNEALQVVFQRPIRHLLDVGGNTGRWACRCVAHCNDVEVTILDLPQQLSLMRQAVANIEGHERIHGYGCNVLEANAAFPENPSFDAIWMSQFLDCFSMEQITAILKKAAHIMLPNTRLFIMETLWDRQKYEPAAFCLTQISLYFTALANGNSKMYNTDDLSRCIQEAGLEVESIVDQLGHGHSIFICKKK